MLLDQVINEIRQLRDAPNRRSAIEIHRLLDGNMNAFNNRMDADSFRILLNDFKKLADAQASEYMSEGYKRDYKKAYDLLMFYLEKIF
jgi:hypothetical protein